MCPESVPTVYNWIYQKDFDRGMMMKLVEGWKKEGDKEEEELTVYRLALQLRHHPS